MGGPYYWGIDGDEEFFPDDTDYSDLIRVRDQMKEHGSSRQDTRILPRSDSPYGLVGKLGDYRRFSFAAWATDSQELVMIDAKIKEPDLPLGLQLTMFPDINDAATWYLVRHAYLVIEFGGGGSVGGGAAHGSSAIIDISNGVSIAVPGIYAKAKIILEPIATASDWSIGYGAYASLLAIRSGSAQYSSEISSLASGAFTAVTIQPFSNAIMIRPTDNRTAHLLVSFNTHYPSIVDIPPGTTPDWMVIPAGTRTVTITNIGAGSTAITIYQRISL